MKKINYKSLIQQNTGWIIAFISILCSYLFLAGLLVTSFDFNDETEKLITAKLIESGLRIYKDIFVQHGPVSYMLSHIFYKIYPSHNLAPYRLIPIVLSLLALTSLMLSPLFTQRHSRIIAGILFLFGLSAFQVYYAMVMTMYQTYAGYFYVIALSLFIIPFALGFAVKPYHALISGFALAMMFFCSFSFSLAIFFSILFCIHGFFVNKSRLSLILYACLGGLIATSLIVLWLMIYGDFLGYLVYHIYFNLMFYGHHIAFKSSSLLLPFALINPYELNSLRVALKDSSWMCFSAFLLHISAFLVIMQFGAVIFRLKFFGSKTYHHIISFILLILLIIFTNSRLSLDFGESTYMITIFSIIGLLTGIIIERRDNLPQNLQRTLCITILIFITSGIWMQFSKTILYGTSHKEYYQQKSASLGTEDSEEMRYLRSVVGENGKVMQLPFNLNFYIRTDRLPASGIFYWMPWMNDYEKAGPIKGYSLNLCEQLNVNRPKAIYYDGTGIWKKEPEDFMPCILDLLYKHYTLSPKYNNIWLEKGVLKTKAK